MRNYLKLFPVFLSFILIAGTPYGSMAAGVPLPPLIKGVTMGNGLLSGMTPGNYKIPSGWSLVRTQDMEGAMGPGEEAWSRGRVTTTKPHSGSKSIEGSYTSGAQSMGWNIDRGQVGSFKEIYISYYEWVDSTARFNDEFWVAHFVINNPPIFQELIIDWMWGRDVNNNPAFNGPKASLVPVSQGNRDKRHVEFLATVPTGAWVQWEIHFRQNAPTDPLNNVSDGFIRIYKNGSLFTSAENVNINGMVSMDDCLILIGGIYTKDVWMTDFPTCSAPSGCAPYPGSAGATDYCTNSKGWYSAPFSNPICSPKDPPLASFNRYLDDIIIMKK